jgi:hypothetical protein
VLPAAISCASYSISSDRSELDTTGVLKPCQTSLRDDRSCRPASSAPYPCERWPGLPSSWRDVVTCPHPRGHEAEVEETAEVELLRRVSLDNGIRGFADASCQGGASPFNLPKYGIATRFLSKVRRDDDVRRVDQQGRPVRRATGRSLGPDDRACPDSVLDDSRDALCATSAGTRPRRSLPSPRGKRHEDLDCFWSLGVNRTTEGRQCEQNGCAVEQPDSTRTPDPLQPRSERAVRPIDRGDVGFGRNAPRRSRRCGKLLPCRLPSSVPDDDGVTL